MEPQSSPQENVDAKATFRRPLNDAGNRIYRRHSPVGGSSSSEGSPVRERTSIPIPLRKDPERGADDRQKRDDGRDLGRDSGRSHYGWNGESCRHSDRQSSRGSRSYHRDDDYRRRDKYADDDDRDYSRSSRSTRDSRSNTYSDHSRREGEKYSRDKSDVLGYKSRDKEREKDSSSKYQKHREKDLSFDRAVSGRRHINSNNEDVKFGERDRHNEDKVGRGEKIDPRRSSGDYKSDRAPAYEESRGYKNDLTSRRDSCGHRLREASRSDVKSLDSEKYTREEKNSDDRDRYKERYFRESGEQSEGGNGHFSKDQESSAKKPKLFSMDGSNNKAEVYEKQSFSSKQAQEITGKGSSEQACLTDSDIDAAKIAAMKAAELVNRNLIGTGYMSADQKKKLLWGNKKTTVSEESNCWDTTIFGDRERQEKFHKLMSLRLHWYLWPIVGCEGRNESGEQTRKRRCREAEGAAPDGFREAIYCWITSKRWSHCWARSLKMCGVFLLVYETVISSILLYNYASMKFTDVSVACRFRI